MLLTSTEHTSLAEYGNHYIALACSFYHDDVLVQLIISLGGPHIVGVLYPFFPQSGMVSFLGDFLKYNQHSQRLGYFEYINIFHVYQSIGRVKSSFVFSIWLDCCYTSLLSLFYSFFKHEPALQVPLLKVKAPQYTKQK